MSEKETGLIDRRFDCYSTNDGDSWYEHPADAELLWDVLGVEPQVGDEFDVQAGWHCVDAKFRVTKAADDESDDVEVECISHRVKSSKDTIERLQAELSALTLEKQMRQMAETRNDELLAELAECQREARETVICQDEVIKSLCTLNGIDAARDKARKSFDDFELSIREELVNLGYLPEEQGFMFHEGRKDKLTLVGELIFHAKNVKKFEAENTALSLRVKSLECALSTVCEGWTLPDGARKTLEAALWQDSDRTSEEVIAEFLGEPFCYVFCDSRFSRDVAGAVSVTSSRNAGDPGVIPLYAAAPAYGGGE